MFEKMTAKNYSGTDFCLYQRTDEIDYIQGFAVSISEDISYFTALKRVTWID